MRKSLLELYALLVCLITVLCFFVNLHTACFKGIVIARPQIGMSAYDFEKHDSEESIRHDAVNDAIGAVLFLIISAGFFGFHWRLAKKEREKNT